MTPGMIFLIHLTVGAGMLIICMSVFRPRHPRTSRDLSDTEQHTASRR